LGRAGVRHGTRAGATLGHSIGAQKGLGGPFLGEFTRSCAHGRVVPRRAIEPGLRAETSGQTLFLSLGVRVGEGTLGRTPETDPAVLLTGPVLSLGRHRHLAVAQAIALVHVTTAGPRTL